MVVSIGAYLKALGYGPATVGYVTSAGLAGAVMAMLLATLGADRVGRRGALVVLSTLGGGGRNCRIVAASRAALDRDRLLRHVERNGPRLRTRLDARAGRTARDVD